MTVSDFFNSVNDVLWGPPILIAFMGCGLLLTIRLKLLQFLKLPFALVQVFKKHEGGSGDISHFAALMTALSATIGTGNIVGVATAIHLGGPGAMFWMWTAALLGMATKYSEAILALRYRVLDSRGQVAGGPMYYIKEGLKERYNWVRLGKYLALMFAICGAVASFGIGSSAQSNSVTNSLISMSELLGFWVDENGKSLIQHWVIGLIIASFTALVVLGGLKSIARASVAIVPFMAVLYVLTGLVILLFNLDKVLPALLTIWTEAFNFSAAAGGAVGAAIRYGVARGVFSNESGMGSAPIAAAAAITDHPGRQALVSMTGTFIDTIIVCSITGIVIVMGGHYESINAAQLTNASFEQLFPVAGWGSIIASISLVLFAYSTILGWCYYGEKCVQYLAGDRAVWVYRYVYVSTVFFGSVLTVDLVWTLSDTFNALMAVPNLFALMLLSGVILREARDLDEKRKLGQLP